MINLYKFFMALIILKFQGWRDVGNVWGVGNVRFELTTGKEGA